VTGVQTCALPIYARAIETAIRREIDASATLPEWCRDGSPESFVLVCDGDDNFHALAQQLYGLTEGRREPTPAAKVVEPAA